jgi:hypothetical protein
LPLTGGFYLLLIGTTSLPELYTGAAVTLLAAAGFFAARTGPAHSAAGVRQGRAVRPP